MQQFALLCIKKVTIKNGSLRDTIVKCFQVVTSEQKI